MTALAVVFAVVMSCATLLALVIFSTLLTWLLAETFDAVAKARATTDLAVLYRRLLSEMQSKPASDDPVPPQFAVCICISPLRSPEYLVGFARGGPRRNDHFVWTTEKQFAKVVTDDMALRTWLAALEHEGNYAFVVYRERRQP